MKEEKIKRKFSFSRIEDFCKILIRQTIYEFWISFFASFKRFELEQIMNFGLVEARYRHV